MLGYTKRPRECDIPSDKYSFRTVSKTLVNDSHRYLAEEVKDIA